VSDTSFASDIVLKRGFRLAGHAYRHDRRYLAIAEQHKGKEILAIYDAGDMYNLIRVRRRV
jgi:hypothetical protein